MFIQQTAMQLNCSSRTCKRSVFRFPGTLPITVERRHVDKICRESYSFTPKADGVRVLLVCLRYYIDGDWRLLCTALRRDGTCCLLRLELARECFEDGGSLFDCELVSLSSGWEALLLFDCYSYAGASMRKNTLQKRFHRCTTLCETAVESVEDSVRIRPKPYFKLDANHLDQAGSFLSNTNHFLEYATDGIVLVPTGKTDFHTGTDESQFKMKPRHTVDLCVVIDDDDNTSLLLATWDPNDDTYVVRQTVHSDDVPNVALNQIVECDVELCNDIATFRVLKSRPDKTHPNTESVVERTLATIRDAVTVDQLVSVYSQTA